MDKAITVTVPVTLSGEAVGVKQQGGLLDFVTREIQVECMPADIPEHIDIDVHELMIGDGVRVRDVAEDTRSWTAVSDLGDAARPRDGGQDRFRRTRTRKRKAKRRRHGAERRCRRVRRDRSSRRVEAACDSSSASAIRDRGTAVRVTTSGSKWSTSWRGGSNWSSRARRPTHCWPEQRGPGARVMLAKPLTYMNRSGGAVQALRHYFRIEPGGVARRGRRREPAAGPASGP